MLHYINIFKTQNSVLWVIYYTIKVGLYNWRASVASETLTGVTQLKIGDVCLFIYNVWTYVRHFCT